ncbi:hypothetical protein CK203_002828 [Vitis vinifera]|uniref:Uncharacterized protein n=1 Tax=Vitis vinifera TaxID=29760 RepID=A0A438KHI7_VITVI|nr:hypothetical protein CK203_002828 [Vitis vinifera]
MGESMWEHKMEVYRGWGLTDDDIMLMFKSDPLCMAASERKIMSVMDFLVNKMGWEHAAVVRYPTVFLCSLEKKIIPWCSVVKVIQMKVLRPSFIAYIYSKEIWFPLENTSIIVMRRVLEITPPNSAFFEPCYLSNPSENLQMRGGSE